MIQLNEQQLKDIETYLMEIPAKFANPILGYLANIVKEQVPQEVKED
jgi:hypothetical protein